MSCATARAGFAIAACCRSPIQYSRGNGRRFIRDVSCPHHGGDVAGQSRVVGEGHGWRVAVLEQRLLIEVLGLLRRG